MDNQRLGFSSGALLVMLGLSAIAVAQTPPDNTKVNAGDQKKGAVTADQQKMDAADRSLTQRIRKAVMADKSLSTYAHNVKIVSRDGMVTLKGPVRSEDERASVIAKAVAVTGAKENVTDLLSVKAN